HSGVSCGHGGKRRNNRMNHKKKRNPIGPIIRNNSRERLALILNAGSSSLKAAVFDLKGGPRRICSASVDRIGARTPILHLKRADGTKIMESSVAASTHAAALNLVFQS